MPPDTILDQEEDYASSEDSDFAPEDAGAEERESNQSEAEDDASADQPAASAVRRKRKQAGDDGAEAEYAGVENSGDEAIIGKGKKRLKRAAGRGLAEDEEGGGEGGLIKTRAQRAAEKVEKKYESVKGPVTIDVDALWQQMLNDAAPSASQEDKSGDGAGVQQESPKKRLQGNSGAASADVAAAGKDADGMIRIKRTYNFAGKVHTEEKLVPRESAEAKLYLSSLDAAVDPSSTTEAGLASTRMPRKAFRSIFEPITDQQLLKRSDLKLGLGVLMQARELATRAEAKKLNTVEKSRMDWAGYVDKEGIKDELELAGKSKTSFVSRQDFLARSEARREEEARRARLAGRG